MFNFKAVRDILISHCTNVAFTASQLAFLHDVSYDQPGPHLDQCSLSCSPHDGQHFDESLSRD